MKEEHVFYTSRKRAAIKLLWVVVVLVVCILTEVFIGFKNSEYLKYHLMIGVAVLLVIVVGAKLVPLLFKPKFICAISMQGIRTENGLIEYQDIEGMSLSLSTKISYVFQLKNGEEKEFDTYNCMDNKDHDKFVHLLGQKEIDWKDSNEEL